MMLKKYICTLILLIGFYGIVFADTLSELPEKTDSKLTYYTYIIDPAAPLHHRSYKLLLGKLIDDTKGNGDTTYIWSANKVFDQLALKLTITDIDDTPVNNETAAPISSNWAYDHAAAADPHTGYMLESNIGFGANNYLKLAASPGTPDTTKFLRDDGTWVTPAGAGGDLSASDINTPAKLETVSNLGAYADTLLGFASASTLFDALIYADSIDSAHINWGEPITVPFDNYIRFGQSTESIGSDDADCLDLAAAASIRSTATTFHHTGNFYATTYGSDGSVSDTEFKYINTLSSNAQTQISARAIGDASVTDENVAVFDTDGYHLKDVPVNIDSTGNVSGVASLVMNQAAVPTMNMYDTADSGAVSARMAVDSDGTDAHLWFAAKESGTLKTVFGYYGPSDEFYFAAGMGTLDIHPDENSTYNIGATDNRYANIWGDAVYGADYIYLNGWRTLESEKYEGYPKGIAVGNNFPEGRKPKDDMPDGYKPVFVVTEDFIEYKGTRITESILEKLIEIVEERNEIEKNGYILIPNNGIGDCGK